MMEMLETYAHQVVSYLPVAQRDELYAEIYDSLCEEFSDWSETRPGAGVTQFLDETKEHPMKYATRLASDEPNYLVGPGFYFSFVAALKATATVVAILYVVIGIVQALATGRIGASLLHVIWALPQALLWVSAAVLGVFVALEKSGETATWLDQWQASDLVPADDHQSISRVETVFELVVAGFVLLWVLGLFEFPGMIRHDGGWVENWTINLPWAYWWAVCALLVIDFGFGVQRLRRTVWTRRLRLQKIAQDVAWIALLGYAAVQPVLLSVDHASASEFLPVVENAVKGGLLVTLALVTWDALSHARRLVRTSR